MNLKMEVYAPTLELLDILEAWDSAAWKPQAFGAGTFEIDALLTEKNISLLRAENIILIADDTAGMIEKVYLQSDESGPRVTIQGPLLAGILGRRILWKMYDLSGTPAAIMRYLVNDCAINPTRDDTEARKIGGLVLADGFVDSGDKIRKQSTGGNLLEVLEELGTTYQIAFGVRLNPETMQMEFWTRQGGNRTISQTAVEPVFYSTELEDLLSSEYIYDSRDYKNIALVAGEGEGPGRVYVVVKEAD